MGDRPREHPCLQLPGEYPPVIETVPLEQMADAYTGVMQGKARFRMALVTKDGVAQGAQPAA